MSKDKPKIDTNFTNKKVDFGIERSQDANSANANLNIVVEEYLRPKGVLSDNKQHDAIILMPATDSENFYHVYVPMVHQTIDMPMILLSNKSPLKKGTEADGAYKIEVITNFNDSTSYMESDMSEAFKQGQMVRIVYSNVVGGIPSKGRIVKKLKGIMDAEQAFILFATGEGEEVTGGSSSTGAANRKSTSRTTPSPVKMSPSAVARRNEKLKKSKKAPCREIYKNRSALSRHNNYDGDMRIFTSNCPDFQSMKKQMQSTINSGVAKNLLDKNGLGKQFKKIMLDNFVGGPYMYQGKAEFTAEKAYKMSSFRGAMYQGEANKKYLSGGGGKKKGLGGKSYAEYWQSQGKLVKTAQGMRMAGAFDCLALPPYLCLKSGFLLNVTERSLAKTNSNYEPTTRASQGFLVNIEQWAATPGLQGRYLSPDGHMWTSAGDGAKLITSGKYKGYYKVNYFNASGHSAKNQYRRGNTAAYFKYNGTRSPKNIVRYKGVGKTRPVELILPWAMAYADYTGDFDNTSLPQLGTQPGGPCLDYRGRPKKGGPKGCWQPGTDPAPLDMYPGAIWAPAAADTKRGPFKNGVSNLIFHTLGGHASRAISGVRWFQYSGRSGAASSTHFVIDLDGTVYQMADLKNRTIHAGSWWSNNHGIGVEHVGPGAALRAKGKYPGGPKDTPNAAWWASPEATVMLKSSAKLFAWLCDKYGIPRARATGWHGRGKGGTKGISGHVEVSGYNTTGYYYSKGGSKEGHHDPGPEFPWDKYIKMVQDADPPTQPNKPST